MEGTVLIKSIIWVTKLALFKNGIQYIIRPQSIHVYTVETTEKGFS